jgi:hypothetical protein
MSSACELTSSMGEKVHIYASSSYFIPVDEDQYEY